MVRRYTPVTDPITEKKQQLKAMSTQDKIDFFTQALTSIQYHCIGEAKTYRRRCRNPVRYSSDTMIEVIEVAEDPSLQEEELDDAVLILSLRLCCYLHGAQPGPPMRLLNAIELYRKTFAVNEPEPQVPLQPDYPAQTSQEQEHHHCDACTERAASGTPVKSEQDADALEAAIEKRFRSFEARFDAKFDKLTKFYVDSYRAGKQATSEQNSATLHAVAKKHDERLSLLENRVEQTLIALRQIQEKQAKDLRVLTSKLQAIQD